MGISTLGTRDKVISFFSNFLRIFSLSSKMRLRFFAGIIVLLASFVAGMADNDDHAIDANMVREEDAGRNDLKEEADVKEANDKTVDEAEPLDRADDDDEEEEVEGDLWEAWEAVEKEANDMTVDEAEPLDRADDDDEEEEEEVEADDVGSEEKPCNRFFTRKNYPCKDGLRYGCHWTKCWRQAKSRSNQWCYTTPIGKYSVCKTHADCADTISHDCSTPKVHGFNSVKVENMDCGDKYFKKHHCRGGCATAAAHGGSAGGSTRNHLCGGVGRKMRKERRPRVTIKETTNALDKMSTSRNVMVWHCLGERNCATDRKNQRAYESKYSALGISMQ